jgi:4,5-dihydroxyphthalate decarboxylase
VTIAMAKLSIGCTSSDRIEALLDARVAIAEHRATLHLVEAQRLFRGVLPDAVYDVAELSMASHIAATGAGRCAYVGIPVFLSRSYRHANPYVRIDRRINAPRRSRRTRDRADRLSADRRHMAARHPVRR